MSLKIAGMDSLDSVVKYMCETVVWCAFKSKLTAAMRCITPTQQNYIMTKLSDLYMHNIKLLIS